MLRSRFIVFVVLATTLPLAAVALPDAPEQVSIDASGQTTPFPHFWEQMLGSGRAILTLRDSYREDLRAVKQVTDFQYVRFHAILHDEVGVYNEDEHGNPVYNFSYVDQIYDGLLKNGIPSRGRDKLHAQEAGLQSRCAPSLLVQAECIASQEPGSLGCVDDSLSRGTW